MSKFNLLTLHKDGYYEVAQYHVVPFRHHLNQLMWAVQVMYCNPHGEIEDDFVHVHAETVESAVMMAVTRSIALKEDQKLCKIVLRHKDDERKAAEAAKEAQSSDSQNGTTPLHPDGTAD